MNASPSSAAQAAREGVAARLVDLRRTAGLKGYEVAARCGWHKSKVSRLENAVTLPTDEDIRKYLAVCAAQEHTAELIAQTRVADQMYVEWKRIHQTGIKRRQEVDVPLYERTHLFRVYCSNVVPGLLQTQGYAESLLTTISNFQGTPNDAPAAAAARLARSHVIRDGDHRFVLLVEEAVLRYRIGGASVMAGQLGYLLEVMSLPSVAFGVIPFAAQRRMWPLETFMVFDDERVQVENLSAEINITVPDEVGVYVKAFAAVLRMAVYGPQARALITAAIDALG
ncbi:helix-turn-helix domain-containing protein [Streptomyces sp. NBC_01465]|uniref:helix-turn-helix domain-containing protein n=1 Tax=Streptomyces sp. NBC_01465 TaxID=2903878 RepID=UPI002E318152|nr:helix-turn-helix transcriptional regulator [Streptomyces sp. NBC_01465]